MPVHWPARAICCIIFVVVGFGRSLAQTYTIPFAEKQPAWVFPLWFTNGDGQKDTIYLAYDQEASEFVIDTVFGEFTIVPNESKFYVRMGPNFRVIASDLISYSDIFAIANIVYPFTIAYDARLLYSDSIPGTPSSLVPKVWVGFGGTGLIEDCPIFDAGGYNVILVDTTINGYPSSVIDEPHCFRDSLVVVEGVVTMSFGLVKWDPPTGLPATELDDLNAWLFDNSLTISVNSTEESELRLYHISGVLLYQKTLPPGSYMQTENLAMELEGFRGPLLLSLLSGSTAVSRKLISW